MTMIIRVAETKIGGDLAHIVEGVIASYLLVGIFLERSNSVQNYVLVYFF